MSDEQSYSQMAPQSMQSQGYPGLGLTPNDERMIKDLSRQGGGQFLTSSGVQGSVSGKGQIELLNEVCDLLREIRDLLKARP